MKKITVFFLSIFLVSTGFAETMTLGNETTYPLKGQKSKIAIQWATSAKELQESNKALIYGLKTDQKLVQPLTQAGNINLNIPKNAQHFRILVWSKGDGEPDLLTNWVQVVPNKTYTLQKDQLIPAVLMSGTGC